MTLICQQLRLIIVILLVSLPLEIKACIDIQELNWALSRYVLQDNYTTFMIGLRCFLVPYHKLPYGGAEYTCRTLGFELAITDSDLQLQKIAMELKNAFGPNVPTALWIGQHSAPQYQKGLIEFPGIEEEEEEEGEEEEGVEEELYVADQSEECFEIDEHAKVNFAPCYIPKRFLCMSRKDAEEKPVCSAKDTEFSEGSCFRYFEGPATFQQAEKICKQNDAVLAAFKSLSQLQNIFTDPSYREVDQLWVGASYLENLSSFRWIANDKLLRPDSPMWSKEQNYPRRRFNCVARSKTLLLATSDCNMKRPFICMNLYSEVLQVFFQREPLGINTEEFYFEKHLNIECVVKTNNNAINLSIRFKDDVIKTVSNQSRLRYHEDKVQCKDAGRYSCNVDFIDSGISVEHSFVPNFHFTDCPVTIELSIDEMVATPSRHIMTSVGSDLLFNCTVSYAMGDFYMEIRKNNKILTTKYDISTVTYNLSVAGCNDSDVYTCRYYQLHPEMDMESLPLFIGVQNCPAHILSFGATDNILMYGGFYGAEAQVNGNLRAEDFKFVSDKLVCNAEIYFSPTTLLIKSEAGNVLSSQENNTVIVLLSKYIACEDKGKLVCQITDHLRNVTNSKSAYTWVRKCEPSFCHHKEHFKRLHPHLSHNATATFCFMMNKELHRIHEKQLFHDGRLLETNSTSKHFINIEADETNPYQYTLAVTIVNVQVEDIGMYTIHLHFSDRTVLTFFITVQNLVQSSSHDQFSPFMTYGLPCIIFLLLVLALVAIYSILKRKTYALKNVSNSGDVAQVVTDGFNYTTLREKKESNSQS